MGEVVDGFALNKDQRFDRLQKGGKKMNGKTASILTITFLFFSIFIGSASADVPQQINYQGYLVDPGTGDPANGPYDMRFLIYSVAEEGDALWSETQSSVDVANGVFNVQIGQNPSGNPFPEGLFVSPLYLEVAIDDTVSGWETLSPRQPITSTPFAMKAADADALEGMGSSYFAQSLHSHSGSDIDDGTVGESHIDTAITRDSELSGHAGDASAHHTKTTSFGDLTDQASDGQLPSAIARDSEVTWANLPDIPLGFADGVDDVGGTGSEDDPEVGVNTLNHVPKWDGAALVTGTIFDNGNVGIGTTEPSAKLDVEVTSSGPAATIGSSGNSATGDFAIAMGFGTQALHQYATAMGNGTNATGFGSTAMGYSTTAGGQDSTAMGHLTNALGHYSTAMGYQTTASGGYATAMGVSTIANGNSSTAMGSGTTASGLSSTAMGTDITVQGDYSFGIGLKDDTYYSITQNNTMAIMGGQVGIGTTTPDPGLKLDVITGIGETDNAVRGQHGNGNYGVLGSMYSAVYANSVAIGVYAVSSGPSVISAINTGTGDLFRGRNSEIGEDIFKVSNDGTITTKVLEITGGSDLAEPFEMGAADMAGPGTVVCIDPDNPGELEVSRTPYDRRVAGIISGAGGIKPGMVMSQEGSQADGSTLVALTGRVFCKADTSNGPIQPGDLLTTSDSLGHAMKVTDYSRAQGAIIGKAMSPLKQDQGLVLVLVTLQ